MDAPIFPTERRSDIEFRSPDVMVRPVLPSPITKENAQPRHERAVLEAGQEYRIERSANGWHWYKRPEGGTGASWRILGVISELPPYVPADRPQRIVKNKVAWHILDDGFKEAPSGRCDP